MPKITSHRTFTGCWTCRRRGVSCDTAVPSCSQCRRLSFACEGYEIRLVWVDPETGTYPPLQRRAYPCDTTWNGWPKLTLDDVDHLIDDSDKQQCQCELHCKHNPFKTFPQRRLRGEEHGAGRSTVEEACLPKSSKTWLDDNNSDFFDIKNSSSSGSDPYDGNLLTRTNGNRAFHITISTSSTRADSEVPVAHSRLAHVRRSRVKADNPSPLLVTNIDGNHRFRYKPAASSSYSSIPMGLNLSPISNQSYDETQLLHHYFSNISILMIPVDEVGNPWKSIYPGIAVQEFSSNSVGAPYYAILSMSALHLANLKGSEQGKHHGVLAARYYGMALRDIRESLQKPPAESYSSILTAILVITLAGHVFQATSQRWRFHVAGALQIVLQYLPQRPWMLSHDAWVITQTFALLAVVAHTTSTTSTVTSLPLDFMTLIWDKLRDVTSQPRFAYTVGGNARLIQTILRIRLLEEESLITCSTTSGDHDISADVLAQADDIIQELDVSLDEEVEEYCPGHVEISDSEDKTSDYDRTLVKLHLHMFNTAVLIYLLRSVLRFPPSSVARYVHQVLMCAGAFVDTGNASAFVWPVFIAAVEAYNPESQALARRYFDLVTKVGVKGREVTYRVIQRVWADRVKLASERQCDPGEISIRWREVMEGMDVDILLF